MPKKQEVYIYLIKHTFDFSIISKFKRFMITRKVPHIAENVEYYVFFKNMIAVYYIVYSVAFNDV